MVLIFSKYKLLKQFINRATKNLYFVKYILFYPFIFIKRIFLKDRLSDVRFAQDYIDNQEEAYKNDDDPWSNFSGPRYRILQMHYQVAISCLEENDKKILDMGCGLGRFSELLSYRNFNVTGIDTSETAIKKAKIRFPTIKFEIGDVRFWGKGLDNHFDAIFLMDCYHRMGLNDKKLALENVFRLLKSNGKIVVAYGLDEYLSGRKTDVYPDLYNEIFEKFVPLQVIRRQAIDLENKTDNANRLYVGIKR